MNPNSKIYIAGHRGMVGSAILRNLTSNGFNNIITKTSSELDLTDQKSVQTFFETEKPEYVFLAAAKVGGIHANNTYRADFLYDNLMIESNVIHQSYLHGVTKLLFLGSSCIYPKLAPQPLKEEYLLSGFLEQTNEPYAIAKIAGIKMCDAYRDQYNCNFISAMPTNLYGPNDNYDLNNSHVLPAMLRKFFEAKQNNVKEVVLWGDGSPFREFLHVDDLAKACVFLMNNYNESGHLNIGSSREISISELAKQIKDIAQYEGNIVWDTEKPNGTPRKLMDSSKINSMGWSPDISLEDGIKQVYQEKFLNK
ncbi:MULTISPECIES: GDP-L-fucose synthase family protein [Chryseobacterium]|uniref:GDP-L-fucose synthase n=1 Tax=Chryseobacterium cucumeris TaxID=1813611 RepID=A0ABX9X667_9FLAO|nr:MULTISPECIES: GDP-L-fucose synthase [Chryseobacterium]KYH06372.1 GDP-fucose synthetase [Chryseobacterium cucumeris]MDH5035067.1 GDP-L-fucose synthase [Chryseobacterium cucumeris]QWT84474.1 GDP-L-fucose synthase [Chryseobacterium sp. PCH239]RKE78864.1 GDP-L-fucose synthase [Chryseobacterium sp. AG363]ROH92424.1 GDP-L-fucose synthase [Chryseobacterium cucumeris]